MADWDSFAAGYDDIFLESRIYLETIELMVGLLEDGTCGDILDLGCGTGNVTARLHERFGGARIVAVDPSEGMLEVAARRFGGAVGVRLARGDALAIPGGDGEFEYALSNIALHHVRPEQRAACAAELARVLETGGELIYADFFSDVGGGPGDPEWCRDIIESHAAYALDCLDGGAYEMMLLMFKSLPATLRQDGEYLTTVQAWMEELQGAGFGDFDVVRVPPEKAGTRILRARYLGSGLES
jgi:ubiquinone/menaquinone biosynthesis C-methylase UbiE